MSLDALQGCLAAEHAAVYGYGVVGGVLAGLTAVGSAARELAATSYVEHRRRRDDLTIRIAGLDADPVAAEPAYDLDGRVASIADCRDLARLLEQRCAQTYADTVSRSVGDDRALAAHSLTACAVRQTAWGARPEAFPGIAEL